MRSRPALAIFSAHYTPKGLQHAITKLKAQSHMHSRMTNALGTVYVAKFVVDWISAMHLRCVNPFSICIRQNQTSVNFRF